MAAPHQFENAAAQIGQPRAASFAQLGRRGDRFGDAAVVIMIGRLEWGMGMGRCVGHRATSYRLDAGML